MKRAAVRSLDVGRERASELAALPFGGGERASERGGHLRSPFFAVKREGGSERASWAALPFGGGERASDGQGGGGDLTVARLIGTPNSRDSTHDLDAARERRSRS